MNNNLEKLFTLLENVFLGVIVSIPFILIVIMLLGLFGWL